MSSIHIKQILCPTDFSDPSNYALKYALTLAERYGATLYLLHVIEPAAPLPRITRDMQIALEERPGLEDSIQEMLDETVPADIKDKVDIKPLIYRGSSFLEIVKVAKKEDIDLIVMATHGHTGLSHLLLGSTTEEVVRKAPCPVLSIRQPEESGTDELVNIKKVLFPTDFSPFAEHALDYAVAIVQDFDAELNMLYIEGTLPYISDDEDRNFPTEEEIEQLAKQQMSDQIEQYDEIEVRRFVGRGTPSEEISNFAKDHEVDLIVMSTHGHSGLKHVLLGSTTERVVRMSSCPVLSIHHPEHEFVLP